jgi:hypothetical protein
MRISRLDEIRFRLEELGIEESDVTDAVAWARGRLPAPVSVPQRLKPDLE